MLNEKNDFIIEDYSKKSVFASFLPGIAGKTGIPIWSFYCNRGQGITSFGTENKDNSIMEFYPAQTAYSLVKTHGFRTFLKVDGVYKEAFTSEDSKTSMIVGLNSLSFTEETSEYVIKVTYIVLPLEKVGALVRKVEITSLSDSIHEFEVLDGMPSLIPYGVSLSDLKDMGQTVKAWMQVEDHETGLPYYRVRASIVDSISVQKIDKGNFAIGYSDEGNRLSVIVDPDVVFEYDNSFITAVGFRDSKDVMSKPQAVANNVPCAFFAQKKSLSNGEKISFYEVYGLSKDKETLCEFSSKIEESGAKEYFEDKIAKAPELTNEITSLIKGKTGNKNFDAYSEATFLDNCLRGGYPTLIGDKVYYMYSRKHGDIERDYNYFRMAPEYYSQGNANYRDICQNRRSDVLFAPFTGDMNAKMFMSLIQTDGFNPLHISEARFKVSEKDAARYNDEIRKVITRPFTPGEVAALVDDEKTLDVIMTLSKSEINSEFGEGYWTDHWIYNLDLIESYLRVYPDLKAKMIYEEKECTYFDTKVFVNGRRQRYVETDKGLRQYNPISELPEKKNLGKLMVNSKGEVHVTTIAEKLLLLCVVKYMTLDPLGLGVEMEGGRPGWYDALNGLPGLFGSSMCESMELCRYIEFMIDSLNNDIDCETISLSSEVAELFDSVASMKLTRHEGMKTWNVLNDIKESYRLKTKMGFSGDFTEYNREKLAAILTNMHFIVKSGIKKARTYCDGNMPAYFAFDAVEYQKTDDGIEVTKFEPVTIPQFLESYVHNFRFYHSEEKKKSLYKEVKESALYDNVLKMYKVNAPLTDASFELGRTKAFTPGWLENESIWLHMEYKYLLELLKNGLYKEFIEDLKTCAIPFLDSDTYGRSILENSSFIASSANPNPRFVGKGFVARLSGSTAEFIDMWQIMMFGKELFTIDNNGELCFEPKPLIPDYLIGEDKTITATLLGKTEVIYKLLSDKCHIPGEYLCQNIAIWYDDGSNYESFDGKLTGLHARKIREGKATRIIVSLK